MNQKIKYCYCFIVDFNLVQNYKNYHFNFQIDFIAQMQFLIMMVIKILEFKKFIINLIIVIKDLVRSIIVTTTNKIINNLLKYCCSTNYYYYLSYYYLFNYYLTNFYLLSYY